MITTILQGGMGNQMFQYAMGLAQARRLGVGLQLDATRLGGKRPFNLGQWNINISLTDRREPTVVEQGMPYNGGLADSIKDGDVLQGYWQSERYFESIQDELRSIFVPFVPYNESDGRLLEKMERVSSVAVHFRRGDYLIEPHKSFHGTPSDTYYADAMCRIWDMVGLDSWFFIFSDDMDYVKKELASERFHFVEPGREAHDIYLMSLCKHAIIANSSFSWWGAWLGEDRQPRVVIAPNKWFDQAQEDYSGIVPNRWIRI